MNNSIEAALTNGLLQGYAGKIVEPVTRGEVFTGKQSHPDIPRGQIYHDEWFVDTHLGGGQELVQDAVTKFTRLYAGGTPDPEVLNRLGLTVKDVSSYLKSKIVQLGDQTRLFTDCLPEPDGDWQYRYRITSEPNDMHITTSLEDISFKGTAVHIHAFILCPIE